MPFLPSFPRRFRKNRRTQKNITPQITMIMSMKIATTPHFGIFEISAVLSNALFIVLSISLRIVDFVDAASADFVDDSSVARKSMLNHKPNESR